MKGRLPAPTRSAAALVDHSVFVNPRLERMDDLAFLGLNSMLCWKISPLGSNEMTRPSGSAELGLEERHILDILQRDCRISNQALAERVHLSSSACWRRVHTLEKDGVIRGYVALVDHERLGLQDCVFVHIRLERHTKENTEQFVRAVKARPEILACYAMSGDEDYMLRVLVPNVQSYDRFLEDFLLELPSVAHVKSNFVLRQIKEENRIPSAIMAK